MQPGDAPSVLLVDDDASNLELVERVLSAEGYAVESAADAAAALDIVKTRGRFDVYVLDVMMPGMSGKELAATIRRDHPDARILYFTGFAGRLFSDGSRVLPDHEAFIDKPASIQAIREAVSLLLFGHTRGPK